MATCSRAVWRVVSGCQRLSPVYCGLSQTPLGRSQTPLSTVPVRTLAAARPRRRDKKEEEKKKKEGKKDDTERQKRYRTATPVDDVYLLRYYAKKVHRAGDAVELLQTYCRLDFTPKHQQVYVDLRLNLNLEKKKKVNPFVSTVNLPHPFKTEMNKVLVFTEDPEQAKAAQNHGAVIVGGKELVQQILDDNIEADFYIAVPEMLPNLLPLKNKLRKKFPKSTRGTVGVNIPKMLRLFLRGHQYVVEENYVRTQIATLDMPSEHIKENLRTIITDICSHGPTNLGPFIERAIIASQTSEALWISTDDLFPEATEEATEEVTQEALQEVTTQEAIQEVTTQEAIQEATTQEATQEALQEVTTQEAMQEAIQEATTQEVTQEATMQEVIQEAIQEVTTQEATTQEALQDLKQEVTTQEATLEPRKE